MVRPTKHVTLPALSTLVSSGTVASGRLWWFGIHFVCVTHTEEGEGGDARSRPRPLWSLC
jgi:hypothetical protein